MSNEQEPDELTEAVILSKNQIGALLLGIPEMIAGHKNRVKMFSTPEGIKEFQEAYKIPDEEIKEIVETNLALSQSVLDDLPSCVTELKEAYSLLDDREESQKTIITPDSKSWPPKPTQFR